MWSMFVIPVTFYECRDLVPCIMHLHFKCKICEKKSAHCTIICKKGSFNIVQFFMFQAYSVSTPHQNLWSMSVLVWKRCSWRASMTVWMRVRKMACHLLPLCWPRQWRMKRSFTTWGRWAKKLLRGACVCVHENMFQEWHGPLPRTPLSCHPFPSLILPYSIYLPHALPLLSVSLCLHLSVSLSTSICPSIDLLWLCWNII